MSKLILERLDSYSIYFWELNYNNLKIVAQYKSWVIILGCFLELILKRIKKKADAVTTLTSAFVPRFLFPQPEVQWPANLGQPTTGSAARDFLLYTCGLVLDTTEAHRSPMPFHVALNYMTKSLINYVPHSVSEGSIQFWRCDEQRSHTPPSCFGSKNRPLRLRLRLTPSLFLL